MDSIREDAHVDRSKHGQYDKIIYVAGKFQNQENNKKYIELCCKKFREKYGSSHNLYINGVSQFSYLYNETTMQEGIAMCIGLLSMCDEVFCVGDYDDSIGTNCEIVAAKLMGIPVKEHADKGLFDDSSVSKKEL